MAAVHGDPALRTACGRTSPTLVLAAAWLGYLGVYIARKPLAVCKKNLVETLGFSPAQLGALDTVFLAAYTCGSFGGGALGDAYGERAVLVTVLAGSSIACALFASSEAMAILAFAWGLNGLMQGVPYPCYMKLLATSFGKRLGSAAGIWQTSCYVGGGVGNLLAGALLSRYGWPAAFRVPSIALIGICCTTYCLTPTVETSSGSVTKSVELCEPQKSCDSGSGGTPTTPTKVARCSFRPLVLCSKLRDIASIPSLVEVSAAYFLVKLVRYALLLWLPFYLVHERKYTATVAGPLSCCFELGGLIGCPLAGTATDKLAKGHRFRVVMPLLLCTATFLFVYADGSKILLPFPIDPTVIETSNPDSGNADWSSTFFDIVILSCIGVCISGPDSIFAGPAAQDIGKSSRGVVGPATVVGMVDGLGSFGSVLQGFVTAAVTSTFGWPAMFRLCGAFLLVSFLLCIQPSTVEARRLRATASQEADDQTV